MGLPIDDTDDAVVTLTPAPDIEIVKTVTPGQQVAPGGDFTFTLVITNPGPTDLTLTTLVDTVYGDLFDSANPNVTNNNCDDLEGDVLASTNPDSSVTCTFVGNFTGVPGDTETDVAEIDAIDENGNPVDDSDDAVVELVAQVPEIEIVKTVAPGQQIAPGGNFTFTLVIANTGPTDLTLDTLVDSVYGDLFDAANPNVTNNTCDDLEGDVLASTNPDSSVTCTFVGNFTGNAGDTETDIAEIDATDEFGTPVDDTDDATVELLPVPVIEIVKTVAPGTLPAPGGDFTFTLVITNPGATDLTLDTLVDTVYGDLFDAANPNVTNNNCDDLEGDVLASADPDASVTCTFVGNFTGASGDTETDVAEIDATDENGNPVDDSDDAVVELTDEPVPLVEVVKTVAPGSLPEPGGVFTFTVVVTNTGPTTLTITSLTDDVYGNIGTSTASSNTCDDLIGDTLAPGGSATCTFEGTFTGVAGQTETDTVTVVGTDENDNTATDDDDAVVTLTPPPENPPHRHRRRRHHRRHRHHRLRCCRLLRFPQGRRA